MVTLSRMSLVIMEESSKMRRLAGPYTAEQNVECVDVRTEMPQAIWPELVSAAVYISKIIAKSWEE